MGFKKIIILVSIFAIFGILWLRGDYLFSESDDFQKGINEKLATILTKQEDIIKELTEIKKELNVIKIRVSSR